MVSGSGCLAKADGDKQMQVPFWNVTPKIEEKDASLDQRTTLLVSVEPS